VIRQVGHEDSRTTLEVYAQVQQRLSRRQVHQAFDDLLAGVGDSGPVPTEGHERMSESALTPSLGDAQIGASAGSEEPSGPRKWSTDAN